VQEQEELWENFQQKYALSNFHLAEGRDGLILAALSLKSSSEILEPNRLFPNIRFFILPSLGSYVEIARLLRDMLRDLAVKGIIDSQNAWYYIRSNKVMQDEDEHGTQMSNYASAPVHGINIDKFPEGQYLEFTVTQRIFE